MSKQITVIAKFTAKPEYAQTVGDGIAGQVDRTRTEAGSIDYHLHRDQNDPNVWIVYENWRSRADFDAHLKMPYAAALQAQFPEQLAKDLELTFCTMISARPSPGN